MNKIKIIISQLFSQYLKQKRREKEMFCTCRQKVCLNYFHVNKRHVARSNYTFQTVIKNLCNILLKFSTSLFYLYLGNSFSLLLQNFLKSLFILKSTYDEL